ncbi:hypothetical protein [Larkinella humicola]|uniref:Uncharacterized protein n=1 Tax=Larkinella humicola TaxID=2607654 RepID=A0A5N1JCT3_9BACT|nr:hypothetical protein [Larkinella humicola]KAA9353104.1 hypothetical protein F0P93_18195 [Larkinella humicola]
MKKRGNELRNYRQQQQQEEGAVGKNGKRQATASVSFGRECLLSWVNFFMATVQYKKGILFLLFQQLNGVTKK